MKRNAPRNAFTLIELLVVVAIIVALLAILLPSLNRAVASAESAVCTSNLRQWSTISNSYLADSFGAYWVDNGHDVDSVWMNVLKNYYDDQGDFRLCPTATELNPGGIGGVNRAWGPLLQAHGFRPEDYGSYGINHWINAVTPGGVNNGQGWRNTPQYQFGNISSVNSAANTPIFADCMWYGGNPFDLDSGSSFGWVPTTPNWYDTAFGWQYDMARFTLPRHLNATNVGFVDGHAGRVELPDLWNLKWHREFIQRSDVTIPWL